MDLSPASLPEKVRQTIERHAMFIAGQTVVVAVSGGPDSVALLHVLCSLRDVWHLSLVAAHLDHGFRGEESAGDAEYVRALCDRLDVPCRLSYEDVPKKKKELHLSSQEAARSVRHAFLRQVAQENGAERIALGHTRDDRVETILLNLLRGAGPEGLAGFPPVRLPLIRPLYDVTRAETAAYCQAHTLQPRIDSSNNRLDYRRNRVRAELLPYLQAHFNHDVSDAILRMAELVGEESRLMEQRAAEALSTVTLEHTSSRVVLNAQELNRLPTALRRRCLRLAILSLRGHLHAVPFDLVEGVLNATEIAANFAFDLPVGDAPNCSIVGQGARLSIVRREPSEEIASWEVTLPVPGRITLPSGVTILTSICSGVKEARVIMEEVSATENLTLSGADVFLFPMSQIRLPIIARSWRKGDRMRPLGLNGTRKLQDIFTDRKMNAKARMAAPVIVEAEAGECGHRESAPRILGLLGVQAGELNIRTVSELPQQENIGACLLLMALSHTGVT